MDTFAVAVAIVWSLIALQTQYNSCRRASRVGFFLCFYLYSLVRVSLETID